MSRATITVGELRRQLAEIGPEHDALPVHVALNKSESGWEDAFGDVVGIDISELAEGGDALVVDAWDSRYAPISGAYDADDKSRGGST